MPPLPEAIILVLAPFAPLFSNRVWVHAQFLLVGAMLSPGARTVTAALRVMGRATERRFTHDHRVLNRHDGESDQTDERLGHSRLSSQFALVSRQTHELDGAPHRQTAGSHAATHP
jgi:hypothetical protein